MATTEFIPANPEALCKLALRHIGENTTLDTIGDDTAAGQAAGDFYQPTVREVLGAYRWPFAKRISIPTSIVETTLDTPVVPDLWAFAFPYPDDCIDFHGVWPMVRYPTEDQKVEHDLFNDPGLGRLIVCDVETPTFLFTANIDDTAQYPPTFVEALSWKLAVKFALSIRKDRAMAKDCMSAYQEALTRAFMNAAREVHLREPMAPHIRARG